MKAPPAPHHPKNQPIRQTPTTPAILAQPHPTPPLRLDFGGLGFLFLEGLSIPILQKRSPSPSIKKYLDRPPS